MTVDPAATRAVIVGIERYAAGVEWNLPGAIAGALRVGRWLRARGVPPERITTLLAPLDEAATTQALDDLGLPAELRRGASMNDVRDVITELSTDPSELLVWFWAGHGVMDNTLDRKLFFPESTLADTAYVSASLLRARLSRADFQGLGRQLLLVEACGSYEVDLQLSADPTELKLGAGRPRGPAEGFVQQAIFSAAQGEVADLDDAAGLFTDVVASWLEQHSTTLPPEFKMLWRHVGAEFEQLRAAGRTQQHPVSLQVHHGDGSLDERTYGGGPASRAAWLAARAAKLAPAQIRRLAEALAATPQLGEAARRADFAARLATTVGAVDPAPDAVDHLERLAAAAIAAGAVGTLLGTVLAMAADDEQRIAAVDVRHLWNLQVEVSELLDELHEVNWQLVRQALARTVCKVPDEIHDVDAALELLADLRGRPVPALVEFVVRLQRADPRLDVPDEWFEGQGVDTRALEALRQAVAAEAGMRRKLVIDLRESQSGAWQRAVTGYLSPDWCSRSEDAAPAGGRPDATTVRAAVVRIVAWARARAGDVTVGFIVGRELARELPERWEYEDEAVAPVPLCAEHAVVLHAAERLAIPQLGTVWAGKLDAIEAALAGGDPDVEWLDQDDAAAIRRAVRASDKAFVALGFAPARQDDPRRDAVMAAIAAGAPHVIWVDSDPEAGYDLRQEVAELIGPLPEFPAAVRDRRGADDFLAEGLRVIWDRMDELPPRLVRLGEEL